MSIESRKSLHEAAIGQGWGIAEYLGRGSFGVTYRIVRENRGWVEEGALKVIDITGGRSPSDAMLERARDAAENEVKLMYHLRSCPNVVRYAEHYYVDWEENGERGCDLLIRMDRLTSLREQMKTRVFSEDEIRSIGLNICDALIACKEANILHRDIKPDNIFYNGSIYLLGDFGISRIVETSRGVRTSTGTYAYVAPEQISLLAEYDARADLYSLALTLYELSNHSRLPFAKTENPTWDEIRPRLAGDPISAPDGVRPAFGNVLLKACAFAPEDRYPDAAVFRAALAHPEQEPSAPISEPVLNPTRLAVPTPAVWEDLPSPSGTIPAKREEDTAAEPMPQKTIPEYLADALQLRQQGAWNDASRACDAVLTAEPNNADAYVGRLLAQLHLVNEDDLPNSERELEDLPDFRNARRYAGAIRSARLGRCGLAVREAVAERKRKQQEEEQRQQELEAAYRTAMELVMAAETESDYQKAAEAFHALDGYRDSANLAWQCDQKAEECRRLEEERRYEPGYRAAVELVMAAETEADFRKAAEAFRALDGYRDSADAAQQCEHKAEECRRLEEGRRYEPGYRAAVDLLAAAETEADFRKAAEAFRALDGYRDSADAAQHCAQKAEECRKDGIFAAARADMKNGDYVSALAQFRSVGDWKDAGEQIAACEKASARQWKKIETHGAVSLYYHEKTKTVSLRGSGTIPEIKTWSHFPADCTNLQIEKGIIEIGYGAFENCTSLTSVSIPDSVTKIGWRAFEGCTALTSVSISAGVTEIAGRAFMGCTSLTSASVPAGVIRIGWRAFGDCTALVMVSIPNSVTVVGDWAFDGCTFLRDVFYSGTRQQWNSVHIRDDGNEPLRNAAIRFAE